MKFCRVSGVINTEDCNMFKKIIFSVSRGNAIVFLHDFNDEMLSDLEIDKRKTIYVVLFREGGNVKAKIAKACASFSNDRFEIPENVA